MRYLIIHYFGGMASPIGCFDKKEDADGCLKGLGYTYNEQTDVWDRESDTSATWIFEVPSNDIIQEYKNSK